MEGFPITGTERWNSLPWQTPHQKNPDHDRSSSKLSVALTFLEVQGVRALAHSLCGDLLASCKKALPSVSFVYKLRATWSEVGLFLLWEMVMWLTHVAECFRSTVCYSVGLMLDVDLVIGRIIFR